MLVESGKVLSVTSEDGTTRSRAAIIDRCERTMYEGSEVASATDVVYEAKVTPASS